MRLSAAAQLYEFWLFLSLACVKTVAVAILSDRNVNEFTRFIGTNTYHALR